MPKAVENTIKAVVSALREFPVVNSSFDIDKNVHLIHENIQLGIAVDINQEGLLVGTIKEADSYNLTGTARKISEISTLLRDGSYNLDDVSGSTFTISNNGSFNSFLTSPIINQPNVAILSTESVKKRPVVIEMEDGSDSISIRHIGILSLTWDHRVFDGSTALLFLNSIKTLSKLASSMDLPTIRDEYVRIFVGVGRGEILPFASYYLTGFLKDKPLAKLRNDMKEIGIELAENVKEPEDHVASLFDMMSGLILGKFNKKFSIGEQKDFFNKHLNPWVDLLMRDIESSKIAVFYSPVGTIGREFIEIERSSFSMDVTG